ncbi:MAG: carboxypeptidase-like regulatory domain-containing protein [Cyclobacterium sp.]|uniref:carboxypeptidase-like regulatory domain-containing protein n=1 Tax=Cyclobacterium sp. TaxID=1966343 RepID=UPI00397070FF
MRHKLITLMMLLSLNHWATAQEKKAYTQTVRGTVLDMVSQSPLPGASVRILDTDPLIGTATDLEGGFMLEQVPAGRATIRVSFLGYESTTLREIPITSGKEVVLTIQLQENLEQMEEVVVQAGGDSREAQNEMATVSARGFDMEATNRFAGSRNDPARMAQNFAGVSGANDSRNDIIIRGNSPTGVLWRLEGVDIPNPNHFGAMGTTGGPVSILNSNLLDKSDFITGAFPAAYGNATAGVFDLNLRKGNAYRREYLVQMGFNGIELGAEGPLVEGKRASYLLNYRYSTIAMMQEVGFSAGTGDAVPYYQDFSMKVDLPTDKMGRFSLFALGGKSNIDLLGSESDSSTTDLYSEMSQNIYNRAKMGVIGINHTQYYDPETFGVITLSADHSFSGNRVDSLSLENRTPVPLYRNHYGLSKIRAQYEVHRKVDNKNNFRMGMNYDYLKFNLRDSLYQVEEDRFQDLRNETGSSGLLQAHLQWQHRFDQRVRANIGVHYQNFILNNVQQVEPRVGLSFEQNQRSTFSLGYGLHSQLQPLPVYFLESEDLNQDLIRTNKNLDFTKSHHFVAGYRYQISPDIHLKSEIYYQHLYGIAVEESSSSFSMLNAGADFGIPDVDSLTNRGRGRNYGLELTLEKQFSEGSYFLLTTSLFDSRYRGSDEQWRNTAFNSQYVLNGLLGKEWQIGNPNRILSLDFKITFAGGQYITPIDLERSIMENQAVYQENRAFSVKNPDYFRSDLKINYRVNKKNLTHEWSLDIQNLTNHQNLFRQTFNPITESVVNSYQLGIFPIPQYRLTF